MYNVAEVNAEACVAQKGCRLCIMYCPEANCIQIDTSKTVAVIVESRCKGCELCVIVCDAAKHNAIKMVAR
jgi:pyruvate ferredoxin oxidoreductase delta subunit